jgi:hypothetical protein
MAPSIDQVDELLSLSEIKLTTGRETVSWRWVLNDEVRCA